MTRTLVDCPFSETINQTINEMRLPGSEWSWDLVQTHTHDGMLRDKEIAIRMFDLSDPSHLVCAFNVLVVPDHRRKIVEVIVRDADGLTANFYAIAGRNETQITMASHFTDLLLTDENIDAIRFGYIIAKSMTEQLRESFAAAVSPQVS